MRVSTGKLNIALCAVASLLLLTLCARWAYADDTSAGVMLPGLRSDPPLSVRVSSASLVVKGSKIELTLDVIVKRSHGGSITVQMPRFGWLGESEPYPDRQFPELQILVDGAPAAMESSFAAFAGSTDVTQAIRAAGVDPFAIAETPPFVTPGAGGAAALEPLKRLGAIEQSGSDYLAKWRAQRKVKVALSGGSHTLTITYKIRPAYSLLRFDQLNKPAYLARYCISAQDLAGVFGSAAAAEMFVASSAAIATAIDEAMPSSLSVAVDTPEKEDSAWTLIAFCGIDGKAVIGKAKKGPASARTDAKGNLRILFLERVKTSR